MIPTFAQIEAARARIANDIIETPLLESPLLNRRMGGRLLLKAECLQTTGSFKLRGAAYRLHCLDEAQRARGIVARSSGNHGLAMAYCAGRMGTSAVIVAPDTAPRAKIDRIREYGARVVQGAMHEIGALADELSQREGRILVPPADDPWVVCGAGTVALDLLRQAGQMNARLDTVLSCCSGGGLTSGTSLVLGALSPGTELVAVEPAGLEKMARSMKAGKRINNPPGGSSICDALSGPYTAEIPFNIVKSTAMRTLSVTDDEVRHAMRVAFDELGLVVEPGGAAAFAAVLAGKVDLAGRTVAAILTGRNVDRSLANGILGVESIEVK